MCDVVAATKVYGYESGKEHSSFQTRSEPFKSAHELLQRAKAEAKKDDWTSRLQHNVKLSRPPKVFIKPIASGGTIAYERSSLLSFLRQNYGDAVAVEMEGRGFLHAIQSNASVLGLVIRGISDLIKRKSHSDAQGYQTHASMTASAFAFQILATLDVDSKAKQSRTHSTKVGSSLPTPYSIGATKTRPWQIALISPGIESPGFHAEVLEYLVLNFGRVPDMDFQLIPLLPKRSLDPLELWGQLDKVRNHQTYADAVILIPDDPDQRFASIQQFMTVRKDIPLVLFDVLFDISRLRKLDPRTLPVSIGGDETEGGAIAANIALDHLAHWNLSYPPHCLILTGADTMWENGRTRGFKETFKSRYPGPASLNRSPCNIAALPHLIGA